VNDNRLSLIEALARAAQGGTAPDDLLQTTCELVGDGFGLERVGIMRFLEGTQEVVLIAASGLPAAMIGSSRQLDEHSMMRRARQTGELVFTTDATADFPAEVAASLQIRALVVLPLFSAGRCLGFLLADRGGAVFEIDQAARSLLTTVAVLAATLLEKALLQEEMQRLDLVKSQFIALASHELRTPAAAIRGITTILEERADELAPEQLVELRSTLHEQAVRMHQLVNQLLDLSKLEAESAVLSPQQVHVRRRTEELVLLLAELNASDVRIEIEPALEALIDPDAFDQIVSNLVGNALRYGEPPVTITAEQRDQHFRLRVEDCGAGVDDRFLPLLFERFTRSEGSPDKGEGSGLGLAIARSYARAHGGDLLYRPGEQAGASFELVIPSIPLGAV
jgi:signal transduction histidine kinase